MRESALREEQRGEVGVCGSEGTARGTSDGQRLHRREGRAVEGEVRQRRQVYASRDGYDAHSPASASSAA